MPTFVHGEVFEDVWDEVLVMAEVNIEGKRLSLRRALIFSLKAEKAQLGVVALRRWLARTKRAAIGQGFESLSLEFVRISGANPGRSRVMEIDLRPM